MQRFSDCGAMGHHCQSLPSQVSVFNKNGRQFSRSSFDSLNPKDYKAYLGFNPVNLGHYTSDVTEIHRHPGNGVDIGLLKLYANIFEGFSGFSVNSICLPEPNIINKVPEYALNAGLGSIDTQIHRHPGNGVDIGLLKLLSNSFNKVIGFPAVNSICLPEPNITNKVSEYALNAGLGSIDRRRFKVRSILQLGHKLLLSDYKYSPKSELEKNMSSNWNQSTWIYTRSLDNTTINCLVSFSLNL